MTKVTIHNWNQYHPLTDEEMLYLYNEDHRSCYEIAAVSCPKEYTWQQWRQHYIRVINLLCPSPKICI